MDGIHDMGGMHGFGPVVPEADEPPFHAPWEGRVHGMMVALGLVEPRARSLRPAIERMGAQHYLATSYYEHWLAALEDLLDGADVVPGDRLEARRAAGAPAVPATTDPELVAAVRRVLTRRDPRQWKADPPRLAPGDQVRVHRRAPSGHTRCPRYVRGVVGTIDRLCPPEPWPEHLVERRVDPVPCYTVRFASVDVWGPDAEPFSVTVDLVEPYLEPAPPPEPRSTS